LSADPIDEVVLNATFSPSTAKNLGKYDDTDTDWVYNGNWIAHTANGPYNGTLHYSTVVNDFAALAFEGNQFILTYTDFSNRGNLDVFVDNIKVGTINQYNPNLTWQKTWVSPIFTSGTHVIKLIHTTGEIAGVDAIEIVQITPLTAGTYDDTDTAWTYSGNWTALTTSGPYNGTLHYSTTVNDEATLFFEGSQINLTYTGYVNRGQMDIYVDNIKVGTINQYRPSLTWQEVWTSPIFTDGIHALKLVHSTGAFVGVDAIEVVQITPLGAGTYDDTNPAWFYTGIWTALTTSGPYNGTLHYSTTINDTATLVFEGTQFTLIFTGHINRGNVNVFVDDVNVGTINQYSSSLTWQRTWTSPSFINKSHTLKLVHDTGVVAGVDAIEIIGP
jgi:hypothetical protein